MYFFELKRNQRYDYFPINGEMHRVNEGLEFLAFDLGDGSFNVTSFSSYHEDICDPNSPVTEYSKTNILTENESGCGLYYSPSFSAKENQYKDYTYTVTVLDEKEVLKRDKGGIGECTVHFYNGDYEKLNALLYPLLMPDKYGYKINTRAHLLQAKRCEEGCGEAKDLTRAYMHYLYSGSYDDVIRFVGMGYGGGVFEPFPTREEWDEYHALVLLYSMGEKEYAYNRMRYLAGMWFYSDAEKNSRRVDIVKDRKILALCRRQACEWAVERNDTEAAAGERLTLHLGAYLAYLECGSEGGVTIETDNGGGSMGNDTSTIVAERYIDKAVANGNGLAIKVKAFIDKVKQNG